LKVLLTGATGFVGSAILSRLVAEGHEVVAVARTGGSGMRGLPAAHWIFLDLARVNDPRDWVPHLAGIEAVVNCAGVLQDGPRDSTAAVHSEAPAALFRACERAGVRRVIQFSAIRIDREAPTAFSRSKLAGDEALMALDLDWVILRPSVVVGRGAYGGSALFRGLGALPVLPLPRGTAPLQVVQLDDVVRTVVFFLRPDAPTRKVIEIAGPECLCLAELVSAYRRWLGWRPARILALPRWLEGAMYRLGDAVALLGWRPPVRSTAEREIVRGATGNLEDMRRLGLHPRSLPEFFAAEPASVQERWFAGMYLLKPLIFVVIALFWIATGIISLSIGWGYGMGLMGEGGVEGTAATLTVIAGALSDLLIGLAIAYRPTTRYGLYAAIAISFTYAIIGTILVPRLWADPLGPMLKIWPIIVLHFAALAVLEDR